MSSITPIVYDAYRRMIEEKWGPYADVFSRTDDLLRFIVDSDYAVNTKVNLLKWVRREHDVNSVSLSQESRDLLDSLIMTGQMGAESFNDDKNDSFDMIEQPELERRILESSIPYQYKILLMLHLFYPFRDDLGLCYSLSSSDHSPSVNYYCNGSIYLNRTKTIPRLYKPRVIELPDKYRDMLDRYIQIVYPNITSGEYIFDKKNSRGLCRAFKKLNIDYKGGCINYFRRWHRFNSSTPQEQAETAIMSAHSYNTSKHYGPSVV